LGGIVFYYCLPDPLFSDPYSTVIEDDEGRLLGAKISKDGQWRFPEIEALPPTWKMSIIQYEDERFYYHPGVDPIAILRAIRSNVRSGAVVSGASTISMQVIRLSRKGKARTLREKVIEALLALRLELRYSKEEILQLYASHAPFGGNVVGLEAAAWRYFKKEPSLLSLSEAACLAVLPNAPGLIHPGRNRKDLKVKRNQLLKALMKEGKIDSLDYELALLEPIPQKPHALPRLAPHYLEFLAKEGQNRVKTSLKRKLQASVNLVAERHNLHHQEVGIENLGILVLDTQTGKPVAYVGNPASSRQEAQVDMVQAKRSSGSVLKPLLYAHLMEEGYILPQTLVKDIPTQIQGYRPRNYDRSYDGVVAADEAISRSLNVPAIRLLRDYGIQRFLDRLQDHGFTTLNRDADYYGLSLILGGGEVTLFELAQVYASLGRQLKEKKNNDLLSSGALYWMFQAMEQLSRPNEEGQWEQFSSSRTLAWKTGTSFGHRDAWAIGVTPEYTIGIWVGNADGEGRHGLIGVKRAGPLLFDVLHQLPETTAFEMPADDLETVAVCRQSGHLPNPHCSDVDTSFLPRSYQKTEVCPYHKAVFLDEEGYLADSDCTPTFRMTESTFFSLEPAEAYYFQKKNPTYQPIPPVNPSCSGRHSSNERSPIAFIYPTERSAIYLPVDGDGKTERAIFRAAHAHPKSILHWHLDNAYLGKTEGEFHSMDIQATKGEHTLLVLDQWGNEHAQKFTILNE
jgi:penicillin-binding protein 1C